MTKFREEALNVLLAEILQEYNLIAEGETITNRKQPDVIVIVGGLKVILEGRTRNYKSLCRKAKERLESGLADISIALFYPKGLNEAGSQDELREKIRNARYAGKIFYWGSKGIEEMQFKDSALSDIVEIINHIYDLYIRNNLLIEKISEVEETIRKLVGEGKQTSLSLSFYIPFGDTPIFKELEKVLGIGNEMGDENGEKEEI